MLCGVDVLHEVFGRRLSPHLRLLALYTSADNAESRALPHLQLLVGCRVQSWQGLQMIDKTCPSRESTHLALTDINAERHNTMCLWDAVLRLWGAAGPRNMI